MTVKQPKPAGYFDVEQWESVYTAQASGDFIFRRGVKLAEEITCSVSSPGELWLDVGCGTGHLAAALSGRGLSVVGVDHDPAMVDHAKRRYLNGSRKHDLDFMKANAYHLPFADKTFDGVVATSLAGCLAFPDRFFREVHRVIRIGGFVVATCTNRVSLLLKINAYLRRLIPSTGALKDSDLSFRLYKDKRLEVALNRVGFAVREVRYYSFVLNWGDRLLPPESWAIRAECMRNSRIGRRLARNFIMLAQKA